jgi:AcrR family transcriptional regulator
LSKLGRDARSDSLRNRAKLLAAGREVFDRDGSTLSVDAVTASAGVGAGTFYRHFTNKDGLLRAMLVDQLDELAALAGASGTDQTIFEFIRGAIAQATVKRALVGALGDSTFASGHEIAEAATRLRSRLATSLETAQRARVVRDDVAVEDILAIVSAAMAANIESRSAIAVDVICDGLRGSRD